MSDSRAENKGSRLPLVEAFYSVQGEGRNTGKAAYFIRIGGCDIGCRWCDTRHAWNAEIYPLVDVDEIVRGAVESGADSVVVTGGEPLMWNMDQLCNALSNAGIKRFLETSGAYPLTGDWNWITLSPKTGSPPDNAIWEKADELKVIVEKESDFALAESYVKNVNAGCCLLLQPEWSSYDRIIGPITEYVKRNTRWTVSLQAHKFMHIP